MNHPAASLPEEFVQRLSQIVPDECLSDVMQSFAIPRYVGVRTNTLLSNADSKLEQLSLAGVELDSVSWCENAYSAHPSHRQALVDSDAFAQRWIYIQNLSSLLPVVLLDPQPGERILDLAAAPGGKTLHIAARMQNEGQISAVEVVRGRFYKLCDNLRTAGATIVRTYLKGRSIGGKQDSRSFRPCFDRCSLFVGVAFSM